jgi:hypothetical protein
VEGVTAETDPRREPLTLGALLDSAWDVIRKRFGALFLLALPVQALVRFMPSGDEATPASLGLIFPIALVLYGLVGASAAHLVGAELTGGPIPLAEALKRGVGSALRLMVVYVLAMLGTLVALLFFVVPGLWFAVSMVAAPSAAALEARGPSAIGRSMRLVRGRWWRTAGFLIVVALPWFLLTILEMLLPREVWAQSVLLLLTTTVATLGLVVPVVIYMDYARRDEPAARGAVAVAPPASEPGVPALGGAIAPSPPYEGSPHA